MNRRRFLLMEMHKPFRWCHPLAMIHRAHRFIRAILSPLAQLRLTTSPKITAAVISPTVAVVFTIRANEISYCLNGEVVNVCGEGIRQNI